jgi:hypothetical protein
MKEANRLVREAAAKISEHVDSVIIFVNKRREDGQRGTWRMSFGAGNYYAQYGHVRSWLVAEEGLTADPRVED